MLKTFTKYCKSSIVFLGLMIPLSALAADYTSTLTNQTKQYDSNGQGYTLEQMATWGNGCVVSDGKKTLAPGETTVMKIKDHCEWAGIKYKMMKGKETVGFVAHSFRNEKFSIEITVPCKADNCDLTGLPPTEAKKSS